MFLGLFVFGVMDTKVVAISFEHCGVGYYCAGGSKGYTHYQCVYSSLQKKCIRSSVGNFTLTCNSSQCRVIEYDGSCVSGSPPCVTHSTGDINCCAACNCSWKNGDCDSSGYRTQTYTCAHSSCGGGQTRSVYDSTCCTGCSCTPSSCSGDYPLTSCPSGSSCESTTHTCTKLDSCGNSCGGTESRTCYQCIKNAPSLPDCPTGYSTTDSGCRVSACPSGWTLENGACKARNSDGCGGYFGYRYCYRDSEYSTAPSTPTTLTVRLGTTDYNITGTTSTNPSIIDYDMVSARKIFSNAVPSGAYYSYKLFNAYSGGSTTLSYEGTTQVQPSSGNFTPSAGPARFEAQHFYYKCFNQNPNTKLYSGTKTGFFCLEANIIDISQPSYKPSSLTFRLNPYTISLSETSDTVIPLVCEGETPEVYIPAVSLPEAKGIRYNYFARDSSNTQLFETVSSTNRVNFTPVSYLQTEGNTGSVTGSFETLNWCDNNWKYSPTRTGRFKVETNDPLPKPAQLDLCVSGLCATGGLSENSSNPSLVRVSCTQGDTQMSLSSVLGTLYNRNLYEYSSANFATILSENRVQVYPNSPTYLKEGDSGSITGRHMRKDRCNIGEQYSPSITGYYKVEVNEPVDAPEDVYMRIDGQETKLSKDQSKPTKIKMPSTNKNVQTALKSISLPHTAHPSQYGYRFEVNNWGVDQEWIRWNLCSSPYPEDYCTEADQARLQNFVPSGMDVLEVLKEGARGHVVGGYYTCNLCGCPHNGAPNGTRVDSGLESGYYLVNRNPEMEGLIQFDPELQGVKNCVPDDNHTGLTEGNTIAVTIEGRDYDGEDEISGMVLYLVKEDKANSIHSLKSISDRPGSYTGTDSDSVGIMIKKKPQSSSWTTNDFELYVTTGQNGTWIVRRLQGEEVTVENTARDDIITINNISADKKNIQEGESSYEKVIFKFDLTFHSPGEDNLYLDGTYQIWGMVFDQYMIFKPEGEAYSYIDQTRGMRNDFNWTFDFNPPVIGEHLKFQPSPPSHIYIELDPSDLHDNQGSGVRNIILDAYRTDYEHIDDLVLELPLNKPDGELESNATIRPLTAWLEDDIGRFNVENSWNLGTNAWPERVLVNMLNNEEGDLIFFATAFDRACNYSTNQGVRIDLRSWIATKGGVMYSANTFGPEAKELDPDTAIQSYRLPAGVLSLKTLTEYQILNEMTTGTKVLMSKIDQFLGKITHNVAGGGFQDKGGVRAVRAEKIQDDNNLNRFWFNYFKLKLEKERDNESPQFEYFETKGDAEIRTLGSVCKESKVCVIYSKDSITLANKSNDGEKETFFCDRKALIMSEGDIHIEPDFVNVDPAVGKMTGCIIIANGNITIGEGQYRSVPGRIGNDGGVVGYDYIEAFMIAEGQILIQSADRNKAVRDGLEIKGSLVSFGTGVEEKSIYIQRSLKLHTLTNPVLVMLWDMRYAKISEYFFGKDSNLYKQEVGFKVF